MREGQKLPSGTFRNLKSVNLFALLTAAGVVSSGLVAQATVINNVKTDATAPLDDATNYSLGTLPATTHDVVFTNGTYATTSFTLNTTALTPGTLNNLNATQAITITGTKSITLNGGTNNAPGAGTGSKLYVASGADLTVSAPLALANGDFNVVGTLRTGAITTSANGTLSKSGGGTWTLAGSTTVQGYPGIFQVSEGTVKLGSANTLQNPSGLGVRLKVNAGYFDLSGYSVTVASIDNTATAGTITNTSPSTSGTLTVDNANNTGTVQSYAGTLADGGGAGTLNLTVASNSGYGQSITLTLAGTSNSYTGVTTVLGGRGASGSRSNNASVLNVAKLANGGANSSIGAASSAASNIVLDYGGTLKYSGAATSTDRLFSVGGNFGGVIEASGTGAVNFTNTGTIGFNGSTAARYLALTGTNTDSNTLSVKIADNTGATSLTKGGSGKWVIANSANTYTGATTVGGGVLNVTTLANGGANSSIGASTNAAGNLVLAGGTLQYTGATPASTDRLFTIAATGGAIDSSGDGILSFTNVGANVSSDPASRQYFGTSTPPPTGLALVRSRVLATDLVAGMTVGGSGGTANTITAVNGPNNISLNGSIATWSDITLTFSSVDRTLTLTGSNTGDNTIAGTFADSPTKKLGLSKTGVGTWVLSGASNYTGATAVSAGKLGIGSTGSINGTSGLTINGATAEFNYNSNTAYAGGPITFTQGKISGSGTIGVALSGGANTVLSPGNSAGTLTNSSTVTLANDAKLTIEIGGSIAGTDYDQLKLTSSAATTLDLNGETDTGNAVLDLSLISAIPAGTPTYVIVNNTSSVDNQVSGLFKLPDGTVLTNASQFTLGLTTFRIDYNVDGGLNANTALNDVVLTVVPEPATLSLLGAGLIGLLGRRRTRA